MSRSFALSFLLVLLLPMVAGAQTFKMKNLRDPVPGTGVAYRDLIAQVFPDLTGVHDMNASATKVVTVRHYHPDHPPCRGPFTLSLGEHALVVREGQERFLVLFIHATGHPTESLSGRYSCIVALYQLQPRVRLLDAVNVQWDGYCGLWDHPATVPFSSGGPGFLVYNHHFGGGAGFVCLSLFGVENRRLANYVDGPLMLNYGDPDGRGPLQTEAATYRTVPEQRTGHDQIFLTVTEVRKGWKHEPDSNRSYHGHFVWDPRRNRYHDLLHELESKGR